MIYAETDFDKITMDQLLGEVEELLGKDNPKKKKKVTISKELERAMSEDSYYKAYPEKKPGMFSIKTQEEINKERKKFYKKISTNTVSEKTALRFNKPEYDLSENQKLRKREQDEQNRKDNAILPDWITPQGTILEVIDRGSKIIDKTEEKITSWLDWFKDLEWYWYMIIGAGAVLALYLLLKVI